ncbi:MAG TPA: glycosyl hydrolase 108 family protein [Caulobacteraceae bacterium]|nr:glycosyl hydrolase 108 family protein [Caulobacteraceae bacterium]
MSFEACLPVILASEGGFVDDPHDPGGATNLGITLATLSGWLGRPASIAEVEALTSTAVAPIYLARYWNPSHACDCPGGVDLMVFDEAVNQGVGRAIASLQAALGVTADGAFGPATKAALSTADPASLVRAVAANREAHYRALPTFPRFGRGWLARLARTTGLALTMSTPSNPLIPAQAGTQAGRG